MIQPSIPGGTGPLRARRETHPISRTEEVSRSDPKAVRQVGKRQVVAGMGRGSGPGREKHEIILSAEGTKASPRSCPGGRGPVPGLREPPTLAREAPCHSSSPLTG